MNIDNKNILDPFYSEYLAIFFIDNKILIKDDQYTTPLLHLAQTIKSLNLIVDSAYLDGATLFVRCQTITSLKQISDNDFSFHEAKNLLNAEQDEEMRGLLLRASHWAQWEERQHYCSKCGCALQNVGTAVEKKCSSCNFMVYPKLSPAIIVLIQRDHEVLLARSSYFKPGVYSPISGFIDIGETAEEAVHREALEELGIEVEKLEYFGSQSWPFPDSFMIAFKARYLRGELKIDKNELEYARWFTAINLPTLPSSSSISRRLIDSFLASS
jgi:NAD+ diphosphatase